MIYSDDHGQSWHKAPGSMSNGGECQVAEIKPGLLIVTGRPEGGAKDTQIAYSTDDGMTWNTSVAHADLPSPVDGCECSIVLHPNGKLYHSGPDSKLLRTKMVVKISADGGASWAPHLTVWPKAAGYSALQVLGNTTDAPIGIYYDRNQHPMIIFEAQSVSWTTFAP